MSEINDTIFTNDLSKEIFDLTYRYENENITDRLLKVAETIASIEENNDFWTKAFFDLLSNFKFVPGGRILSNAGTPLKGTTYINCFVDGFSGENQDSMEGIMETLRRQALILKSEGGYGFCADVLRPRGGFISGIGNETPGAVKMLDMWDTQSSVITAGSGRKSENKGAKGKIRKGAQMVTMSCWHPDIEEFIKSKQTPGRLTKFNMSVLITDEFIDAVKNHKSWDLEFPDFDNPNLPAEVLKISHTGEFKTIKDIYKAFWNGNLKAWKKLGFPTKIYRTYEDANELWDLITKSTYTRNEPGVLFVDTINRLNNLYYCEYISATNPCGEQILPVGGACLLGSLNLTQFVKDDNWDYDELEKIIPVAVRFMDNVNDLTYVPLKEQQDEIKSKRRIGLGIMGYGSALYMMKVRYGSEKALKLTEELMTFISNKAYQSSSLLAKEKGCFLMYDKEKYLSGNYIKTLQPETIELILKYGIRNSHLMSIQPTGNTSVLVNCVSGGLEPVFLPEYIRTSIMPYVPEGLELPTDIDWENKKCTFHLQNWVWIKEGDETMLSTVFDEITYKIDKNRGLVKESLVMDYGVRYLKEKNQWDEKADWAVSTDGLNIDDHINTMEVFSQHICSAMSKTINLPENYSFDEFKNVYLKAFSSGTIKGVTTYRAGTMAAVLSEKKTAESVAESHHIINPKERNGHIIRGQAPHRPKSVPCNIHHLTCGGQKWTVFVGLVTDENEELSPYEVFAFKKKSISLPDRITTGTLTKMKRGKYNLATADGLELEDISSLFDTDEQQSVTRLISLGLRHGADIKFIVEQLNKASGGFADFNKAIARTLKTYIKDNEKPSGDTTCPNCHRENALIYSEGCVKCKYCELSMC